MNKYKHPVQCTYSGVQLRRFQTYEFQSWKMSAELLIKLDLLALRWRELTGYGITVSPAKGALGRKGSGTSMHYPDSEGNIRAIDIFPGVRKGVQSANELCQDFYDLAVDCGFTGIGIYPDAKPEIMFHLDVRPTAYPLEPKTWGALRPQKENAESPWDYVAYETALETI